jgi:hypothetical protein
MAVMAPTGLVERLNARYLVSSDEKRGHSFASASWALRSLLLNLIG